jgi:hypothetical protein
MEATMFDTKPEEMIEAPSPSQGPPLVQKNTSLDEKVRAYLTGLAAEGKGLPSHRKNGRYSKSQIATQLGFPNDALLRNRCFTPLFNAHKVNFGTEVHAAPAPQKPSLVQAEADAVAKRRDLNTVHNMGRAKDLPVVRAVFLAALSAAGVRSAKAAHAETAIAALARKIERTPGKVPLAIRREFPFVKKCVDDLIRNNGLSPKLGPRIGECLKYAGIGVADAAKKAGCAKFTLENWIRGIMPAKKCIPRLEVLEDLCGRMRGTLTDLIVSSAISYGDIPIWRYPADIREPQRSILREAMANVLPPWSELRQLPEVEQERLMNQAHESQLPIAQFYWARSAMVKDHYAIKEWPPLLQAQWAEWVQHHQVGVPHFSRRPKKRWGDTTVHGIYGPAVGYVLGVATSEYAGALRLKVENLDFAVILSDPRYLQMYIDRKSAKRKASGGTDDVTTFDAGLGGLFAGAWERRGWARQSAFIRKGTGCARMPEAEWAFKCEELAADFREKSQDTHAMAQHTVPVHFNVRSALQLRNPMQVVQGVTGRLAVEWRKEKDPKERAQLLQDLIHIQIQAQCGFRPGTTVRLTYRRDNSGHLKRDAQGWFIHVPFEDRRIFKNWYTPRLIHGFKRRLIDQWGFFDQLKEFVGKGRETLIAGATRNSPYLFFFGQRAIDTAGEGTIRQGHKMISALSRALSKRTSLTTRRVLKHLKIPGLLVLAPTDFRDILATTILKQHAMSTSAEVRSTGIRLAADAIADSEETVDLHYVQYLPEERAAELTALRRSANGERPRNRNERRQRNSRLLRASMSKGDDRETDGDVLRRSAEIRDLTTQLAAMTEKCATLEARTGNTSGLKR